MDGGNLQDKNKYFAIVPLTRCLEIKLFPFALEKNHHKPCKPITMLVPTIPNEHKPHPDPDIPGKRGCGWADRSQETLPSYDNITPIILVLLKKHSSAVKPNLIQLQLQQL